MDAVEQALMTGGQVPGLRDYLTRAGLYYVVVRNDLDPDQIGYVPTATVKRTLEESGFKRVTGFGPTETGGRIADDTPVQVEGLYPRQRAVEIYAPGDGAQRPGQAGLKPVANTAVVSGGPEALLPLLPGERNESLELGMAGIGIADRNSVAGVVRAWVALNETCEEAKAVLEEIVRRSYAVTESQRSP